MLKLFYLLSREIRIISKVSRFYYYLFCGRIIIERFIQPGNARLSKKKNNAYTTVFEGPQYFKKRIVENTQFIGYLLFP